MLWGDLCIIKQPNSQMKSVIFIFVLLLSIEQLTAQTDTLQLTLPDAEQTFLQKNFVLLAQKFNINLAEAAVQQAKLWDNPNLQLELNAYNPNGHRIFPLDNGGDPANPTGGTITVTVSQIFNLARNRSKFVALNQTNVELQMASFQDLMRILRYQLAQTFGNLSSEIQQLQFLNLQRQQLENLLTGYRAELKLGVVAEYEVTRLELEQKNADTEIKNLLDQISQDQATLRILLANQGKTYYLPQTQNQEIILPSVLTLNEKALDNRTDLKITQKQIAYAKQNLVYQQSVATPRLTIGLNYQSYGSAYPSFYAMQAGIDLPVKNRNQGNIQAAKVGIEQSYQGQSVVLLQVSQDVNSSYEQLEHAQALSQNFSDDYLRRIEEVNVNARKNYAARTIDLVSFIDKIRAYKDAKMNQIQLNNSLFQTQQQLNFVTNSKIF
jgi:cobalt-zinc-cadmium efflux system outer membrane protein